MLSKLRLRFMNTCGVAIVAVALSQTAVADFLDELSILDTPDNGFSLDLPDLPPPPPPLGGGPNETDHTAQDPKPPDTEPPRGDFGFFNPPGGPDFWTSPWLNLSDVPWQLPPDANDLAWSSILAPSAGYGSTTGGVAPLGPIPAPGVLTLLGLGALLGRSRRRR